MFAALHTDSTISLKTQKWEVPRSHALGEQIWAGLWEKPTCKCKAPKGVPSAIFSQPWSAYNYTQDNLPSTAR